MHLLRSYWLKDVSLLIPYKCYVIGREALVRWVAVLGRGLKLPLQVKAGVPA